MEIGATAADSEGEAWTLFRSALFVLGDMGVLSCFTDFCVCTLLGVNCTDVQFRYSSGMPAGIPRLNSAACGGGEVVES
jgi:hypothetical protein